MTKRLHRSLKSRSPATVLASGLIVACAVLLCLIHPAIAAGWLASTAFCTWTHA